MNLDPASVTPREVYRLMISCITPRPIAWVSTVSPRGIPNLAPFSFFNGVGANPPTVVFCPVNRRDGSRKDTLINIEATPEFVVNVVPYSLAGPMNESSAELPYEVSEFDSTGLTAEPAFKVKAPRVKEAPVHFECVLHQIVPVGEGALGANLVIGRIVWINVADRVLGADGQVDPQKLDTIGRMGGNLYSRTTERFELPRPQ
ncbi:MAG TPA: flavin reductase family protein [Planctomycetota bacterium]|jgi:flavin reductase (DIM6/NTAB) family NADH-FMN oxidoreductase RutF|nr:flavin reductase family protein [Planctomycetota bacterium]